MWKGGSATMPSSTRQGLTQAKSVWLAGLIKAHFKMIYPLRTVRTETNSLHEIPVWWASLRQRYVVGLRTDPRLHVSRVLPLQTVVAGESPNSTGSANRSCLIAFNMTCSIRTMSQNPKVSVCNGGLRTKLLHSPAGLATSTNLMRPASSPRPHW